MKMIKRRLKELNSKGGFSLLDIMIGLFIVSIIVVTTFNSLGSMFKINTKVNNKVTDYSQIKDIAEWVYEEDFIDAEDGSAKLYNRFRHNSSIKGLHRNLDMSEKAYQINFTNDVESYVTTRFYTEKSVGDYQNTIRVTTTDKDGGMKDEIIIWKEYNK